MRQNSLHLLSKNQDWLLGKSTVGSLQGRSFYSHLGAIRHVVGEIRLGMHNEQEPVITGTGGFAKVVCNELPFDVLDNNFTFERYPVSTAKEFGLKLGVRPRSSAY